MLFLLRVVLVVGVLSYLALVRNGADPGAEAQRLARAAPVATPTALAAVPPETHERLVKDVLARGLMAELSRRASEPEPPPPSRDTLVETDRDPAWRGIERR